MAPRVVSQEERANAPTLGRWTADAALLAAPPAMLCLAAWVLSRVRGPFNTYGTTDPEYSYLLNALTLAQGDVPYHVDHPGAPLQALGAAVLRATHALTGGTASLVDDVLRRPERYLSIWHAALVVLVGLASLAAGLVARRAGASRWEAAVLQLTPFLSLACLSALYRVQPEPLLVALSLPFAALLLWTLDRGPRTGRGAAAGMGVLAGLAIATKVTFAPIALVPLAALRGRAARLRFGAWALAALVLGLAPIHSELPRLGSWLWDIATHGEHYGRGAAQVVDWPAFRRNLAVMPSQEPLGLALAAACALVALGAGPRAWKSETGRPHLWLALAVAAAQAALLLLVAKHPRRHYLVPLAALNGLAAVLAVRLAREGLRAGARVAAIAASASIALTAGAWQARVLARECDWLAQERVHGLEAARYLEQAGPRVVHGVRVASTRAALQFGNYYTGLRYTEPLARAYPGFVTWDWVGLHRFGTPTGLRPHVESSADEVSFPFIASEFIPRSQDTVAPGYTVRLQPMRSFGAQVLYRVVLPPPGTSTTSAFSGFFDSEGLQRVSIDGADRWGMTPSTRLDFVGNGGTIWLSTKGRARPGTTAIRLLLNGGAVSRQELRPGERFKFAVQLAARRGLNELTLAYEGPAPTRATDDRAVRFRWLQLVSSP